MNATAALPSSSAPAVALSPDNVLFEKYEIGKLLGCGAFAKVYHAKDVSTGRSVAVKVINKSRLRNKPILMNNIIREISIMSRLRHHHIVKIFEVMATKRKIYLVMEYLKGGELFSRVAKGRFTEDLARKYFHQLISAVSFCHHRGVYHRDLKLENMLLDDHGNLKVSDFGLSALNEQKRADDGLLHTICGTPAYVAPEILAKKGYDGAKADVWSCGVVLFVLTAGYLPFNDQNLMNMYRKIYRGEFRCPKWMSPDLRRFISRLLDTNPATRITIDEIKQDPWFKRGYREIRSEDPVADLKYVGKKSQDLNAFDIISFSRGLDLSGMFRDAPNTTAAEVVDRVTAEGSPEGIIEKVEAAVKAENGGVLLRRKKGAWAVLEGQNGNFTVWVEVFLLTDRLVMVEVKRKAGDDKAFSALWNDKIRPVIQV